MQSKSVNKAHTVLLLLLITSITLNVYLVIENQFLFPIFTKSPAAMVKGPIFAPTDIPISYSLEINDPTHTSGKYTVYYAPVTETHQDNWNQVGAGSYTSANTKHSFTFTFPTPGKYWVMANINAKTDTDRVACTGNPSYSKQELRAMKLPSCGDNSYIEVVVTPNSSNSQNTYYDYREPLVPINYQY